MKCHWNLLGFVVVVLPACQPAHKGDAEVPTASVPVPPAAPSPAATSAPADGTPADGAPAPTPDCEAQKEAIVTRLDEAARCKLDSDCTTMLPGCPFGCWRAVNAAVDLTSLESDISAYNHTCNRCAYRCRPIEQPPVCSAGMCSLPAPP